LYLYFFLLLHHLPHPPACSPLPSPFHHPRPVIKGHCLISRHLFSSHTWAKTFAPPYLATLFSLCPPNLPPPNQWTIS
jgi:hypothetical protein